MKRHKFVFISILILLIFTCIIVGLTSCSQSSSLASFGFLEAILEKQEKAGYEDKVNQITQIDYTERQDALNELVESGMINVCYSASATFDGKISRNFNIQNSINNHHPMIFEITNENGEIIYKSKKINPGYELNSIELTKELSKGTHQCSIKVGYADAGNVLSVFPITIEVI